MEPLWRRSCVALIQYSKVRFASTSTSNASKLAAKEKWDIIGAVCLQRRPLIAQPLTDMETKFSSLLTQIEVENSLKSDHEFRHENDIKRMERLKTGETDESDLDQASLQTAQDFEDASQEELNSFLRLPVIEADNDQKSLGRALEKRLHLVVQQNLGKEKQWALPHAVWKDGETLRQTGERVLKNYANRDQFVVMGNAPCGFYKVKYPKALQQEKGVVGGKVFFFKAFLKNGANIKTESECGDKYVWLTQKELPEFLPGDYHRSVTQFLVDED